MKLSAAGLLEFDELWGKGEKVVVLIYIEDLKIVEVSKPASESENLRNQLVRRHLG